MVSKLILDGVWDDYDIKNVDEDGNETTDGSGYDKLVYTGNGRGQNTKFREIRSDSGVNSLIIADKNKKRREMGIAPLTAEEKFEISGEMSLSEETGIMKYISSVYGGYALEERHHVENNVVGKFMSQFKTYLPIMFENMFGATKTSGSLGREACTDFEGNRVWINFNQKTKEMDYTREKNVDGVLVYEELTDISQVDTKSMKFIYDMREGRYVTVKNFFYMFMVSRNLVKTWHKLRPDQKANARRILSDMVLSLFVLTLYGIVDDDDENSYLFKMIDRIYRETHAPYNLVGLLEMQTTGAPPLKLIGNIIGAWTYTFSLDSQDDKQFWKNNAIKHLNYAPIGSLPKDLINFFIPSKKDENRTILPTFDSTD